MGEKGNGAPHKYSLNMNANFKNRVILDNNDRFYQLICSLGSCDVSGLHRIGKHRIIMHRIALSFISWNLRAETGFDIGLEGPIEESVVVSDIIYVDSFLVECR